MGLSKIDRDFLLEVGITFFFFSLLFAYCGYKPLMNESQVNVCNGFFLFCGVLNVGRCYRHYK